MPDPASQTLILTGAANGIGRASALALAKRGYRLGLIDRDVDRLAQTERDCSAVGATVTMQVADVTDLAAIRHAVGAIEEKLGPIDMVFGGAGIGGLTLVNHLDPGALKAMLDVNVVGVANLIDAVLPGMFARKRGHIFGVSSVAGFRGLPWMAAYCASKSALTAYLEGLRPALKLRGVRVTTICPGFVRTAITADTPFKNPIKMLEPEQAAQYIVRAIERKPRDFVFPFSTKVGMSFLKGLPTPIFDWMMDRAGPTALNVDF